MGRGKNASGNVAQSLGKSEKKKKCNGSINKDHTGQGELLGGKT